MKIAIPVFKFGKRGGIERHNYELVERWRKKHEIHIFTTEWENMDGVIFHKLPAFGKNFLLNNPLFLITNSVSLALKRKDFDIIINNGCGTTLVQDIIITASVHKAWEVESRKNKLKKWFLNPLHYLTLFVEHYNYTRKRYKKIICVSNFIKEKLIEYHHIPEDDIRVIRLGVNTEEFHPDRVSEYRNEIRNQFGFTSEDFVLLFVANELRRKGLNFLIEALERLGNNFKLLVGGRATKREVLFFKEVVRKKGLENRVVFGGFLDEVIKYYSAGDVFVFPSTFDAFAMVVLEAMSSGLPVITTPSVGAAELVENGKSGFIIKSYDDIEGMFYYLNKLYYDSELRKRMGEEGRKIAENYSWDIVAEKTLEVIEEVFSHSF